MSTIPTESRIFADRYCREVRRLKALHAGHISPGARTWREAVQAHRPQLPQAHGYLCRNASFHCRGGLRGVASMPAQAVAHRSRRRARLSSIIRLEGTMRMIFPLPPLLLAGATLGGLFAFSKLRPVYRQGFFAATKMMLPPYDKGPMKPNMLIDLKSS